jgi:deoxyribonuclease V
LIACVDVDYREQEAVATALWFRGWTASVVESQAVSRFNEVAEYEPGAFYRRELPCLLEVLKQGPPADLVLVDGYVWLGQGAPGLGAYLHQAIGKIVVGVAKTRFASATDVVPVVHGASRAPLYVTAVGMLIQEAAESVARMHGEFRLPTLLKMVDRLARTA